MNCLFTMKLQDMSNNRFSLLRSFTRRFRWAQKALYGARPKPDENGIYPYVYNMGIYTGMLVRGNDGNVYRSKVGTYEMPQDLLFEPKDVPAMLERVE